MAEAYLPRLRRRWYSPVALLHSLVVRPKIILAVLAAIVAFAATPDGWSAPVRAALAWNAGGLAYLAGALRAMLACDSARIRRRAAQQDDSAIVILLIVLTAIAASFVSIAFLIGEVWAAAGAGKLEYLGLAVLTIVISWCVTQVVFTLHYAHEYYAPPERQQDAERGLVFPDDDKPDYWDFLYFAVTIGAASQTSDTAIRSKSMRRLVTLHAAVAFFFNTMVLALMVNLAAGLLPYGVQGLR